MLIESCRECRTDDEDRAACMADVGVKVDVAVDGRCGTCV
jgi:hypothetical protein